jgi:ubiquinone/menaquinone biosynthesis C-methylase UbiE
MHVFGFMSSSRKSIASAPVSVAMPVRPNDANQPVSVQGGLVSDSAPVSAIGEAQRQARSQLRMAGPAQIYESEWVPALFEMWATATIASVRPKLGDAVLDVACGTGVVARLAARDAGITGRVVGVDLNMEMLSVAQVQSEAAEDLSSATIEWQHADACALPLPDASFNIAYCQFGLPFFSDRSAALQEMHRVLVPGAEVVFTVWQAIEKSPGFAILARTLEDHIGFAHARIVRSAYDLFDVAQLGAMLTAAQFEAISVESRTEIARFRSVGHLLSACLTGSRLGEAVARADDSVRRKLVSDLCARLAPYVSPKGLAFPVEALLIRARK